MAYHVRIPFEDLVRAYEQGSSDKRYFLDVQTGEIVPIFVAMLERGANTEDAHRIAKEVNTRYFLLPHMTPSEGYEEMEDFIETVKDKTAAEQLTTAIEGKGAFRRFREILAIYPAEEERWFRERTEIIEETVEIWLEETGISLEGGE
mgnify:CR=1 FL=1